MNRWLGATLLGAALLAAPAKAGVMDRLKGALPGGYAVSGKDGTFTKQMAARKIDLTASQAEASLGFADGQGAFQNARLPMPKTEAALATLAAPAQTAWPYAKPQNVRFIVTAVASYAPEALADGTIVVPLGLLRQADTDEEVVFLLGHEYGHLALGHFAKNEQLRKQRRMLRMIADLYLASVEVSEIRAQKVGDQVTFAIEDEARIQKAADRAALTRQRLQWMLDYGVTPLWGRRQEDEADAIGFDLAVATKRNAELGSDTAFNRFVADAAAQASIASQLQTQLQDALQVSLATTGQQAMDTGDYGKFTQAMTQNLQTGLRDRALRSLEKHLSPKHRPPADRTAGLVKYASLAYPDRTPPLKIDKTWLTEVRKTKEYQDADKALTALLAAQEARAKGDDKEAAAKISVALGTSFGGQPVFANEAGAIFTDLGDVKQADLWYSRADANLNQSLDGFHSHIDMLVGAKLYPKALQVIALAKGRIGSDRDFLPELVRISFKTRKTDQGIKYLEQCMADADTELQQNCMMAAVRPEDAEWQKLPESSRLRIEMASRSATTKSKTTGLGELLKSLDLNQEKD
jgi:predicted Zn-dependent protease